MNIKVVNTDGEQITGFPAQHVPRAGETIRAIMHGGAVNLIAKKVIHNWVSNTVVVVAIYDERSEFEI